MQPYRKYWGYTLAPVVFVLIIAYWSFDFIEQTIRNHPELNLMILAVIAVSVVLVWTRQYYVWKEAQLFENYRKIYTSYADRDVVEAFLQGKKARIVGLLRIVSKLDGKIERTIDQQALSAENGEFERAF